MIISVNLTAVAHEFGFDRTTAGRALENLARAGLVRVERHAGRKPIVTMLINASGGSSMTEREPTEEVTCVNLKSPRS
jgi:DNA-binding transcriptional regulator YhcF (GntR family)